MYRAIIFAVAGLSTFGFALDQDHPDPSTDKFIDYINTNQNHWIASRTYSKDTPTAHLKRLSGTLDIAPKSLKVFSHLSVSEDVLPDTFDAREKWPNCPSIGRIRNQGICGSCWAYAPVQIMTDRYCIHSNGIKNFRFSAEYLVACCSECGYGCNGGYSELAWLYWLTKGIVSGGPFESKLGCMPYTINKCQHFVNNVLQCDIAPTPCCTGKCREGYTVPYIEDFHRGASIYTLQNDVQQIQRDIFKNGPVQAVFDVHSDFYNYVSGVYKYTAGDLIGRHSVKILGWGVEDSKIPYWLVANSWGSHWGIDGYFKILRGNNECGIEAMIFAGIPYYPD